MFFLLRVAFWLTIVLALLPSGGGVQQSAQAKVGAADAVVAASAAVSDMSGFCERQPEACTVGAQTAAAIGQRAQAGARMVYGYLTDHTAKVGAETATGRRDRLGGEDQTGGRPQDRRGAHRAGLDRVTEHAEGERSRAGLAGPAAGPHRDRAAAAQGAAPQSLIDFPSTSAGRRPI